MYSSVLRKYNFFLKRQRRAPLAHHRRNLDSDIVHTRSPYPYLQVLSVATATMEQLREVTLTIKIHEDGTRSSALRVPITDLERLSVRPLKWLRFVAYAIMGVQGELYHMPGPSELEGEVVNYAEPSVNHLQSEYYFVPSRFLVDGLIDDQAMNFSVMSSVGSARLHNFWTEVAERDGDCCIFTGFSKPLCIAAHIIPHAKGDERVLISRCPVGIVSRKRVDIAKPRTHIYDGFIAVNDNDDSDLEARVYVYVPPGEAAPEDRTYFVCARLGLSAAVPVDNDADGSERLSDSGKAVATVQYLELFVSDSMRSLPSRVRFAGYTISCGKANQTPSDVADERGFDMSISQWMGGGNCDIRLRIYIPDTPKFSKTRIPGINTSLSVAGHLFDVRDGRCFVHACDVGLGPIVANTMQYNIPPPRVGPKKYDWGKGKMGDTAESSLKRKRDDDGGDSGSQSSHNVYLPPDLLYSLFACSLCINSGWNCPKYDKIIMPLSLTSDAARSRERRQDSQYNVQQRASRAAHARVRAPQTWWGKLMSRPPSPFNPPSWNRRCPHCCALLLSTEPDNKCCGSGHRLLPRLPSWPSQLTALLQWPSLAKNFVTHCRSINNFFSFAGIAVSGGFTCFPAGTGPPTVTITGRTYHIVRDAETPAHSIHWFLHDKDTRTSTALDFGIHATIVQGIRDMLLRINPYVHSLRPIRPSTTAHVARDIELREHTANGEFVALLHVANTTITTPHSIIIQGSRQPNAHILDILTRHYRPLHYVLFFPHGDPGWGISPFSALSNLSQIQWYRSRLFRDDDDCFTTLGQLTCEYLVDMYSRVEEERLSYISREWQHQAEVEAERSPSPDDGAKCKLSLPASFVGSRAWASEETADSMALGRCYSKLSFFCTMTFNPNWLEVRAHLTYSQSASDIPFIIAHVFKARLDAILHILRTRFGKKLYLIKIVEFQRRGFPHAHIVFKISPELPIGELDMLISAELPIDDLALREKVLRYNMHPTDHLAIHQPGQQSDDIQDYVKGRYLSAPEAAWRILGYDTTRKEPSVTCLPIHLPGENRPQFCRVDMSNTSSTSFLDRYFLRPPFLSSYRYEMYFEQFILYAYNGEPLRDHEVLELSDNVV
ncbi:hypothetical protein EW146_g4564 [Bondarzewia mesenterica]|uniref:Helitron helicase-like domain-containing protein n=1 Tax=Bondarzewia mesenterica TaxID=1095465 RepID=A0A4S4LU59_9AGAM|nr:hypothetical protein EW146_g4564 [Bondarzewia mesenterica]